MKIPNRRVLHATAWLIPLAASVSTTPAFVRTGFHASQVGVMDEGAFRITVEGVPVGTEEFVIRSLGDASGAYLANARVELGGSVRTTILRASAPDGESEVYELSLEGDPESFTVSIPAFSTPRFNSTYTSEYGQETREYAGNPLTRVLEAQVAHHHFFLAALEPGEVVPVIVPGERRSGRIEVTAEEDDLLTVGGVELPTRKVAFAGMGEGHFVWFDARNRVIRVEIREHRYVAERTEVGTGALSVFRPRVSETMPLGSPYLPQS
ncbi:MAG: hypothetical protein J4G12_02425 [Gemmatimonadetes bacterium]|nr:hypothetical protein [Gemmatimonadota bacterium]